MLVSTDEARAHLRIDTVADDPWLKLWIPAISQAVLSWIKSPSRAYEPQTDSNGKVIVDSNGDPVPMRDSDGKQIIKPMVKSAVLVELAQQYRFRDGSGAAAVPPHAGHGYILGAGATALLTGVRRSTVS